MLSAETRARLPAAHAPAPAVRLCLPHIFNLTHCPAVGSACITPGLALASMCQHVPLPTPAKRHLRLLRRCVHPGCLGPGHE